MCSEHLFLRLHIDHDLVSACRQPQDPYAIEVDALANVKTIRGVVHQNTTLFTPVLGDTNLERKLAHFLLARLQACSRYQLVSAIMCYDNIHFRTHARTVLLARRPVYNRERLDMIGIPQKRRTGRQFTAVRGRAPAALGRRYPGRNDI